MPLHMEHQSTLQWTIPHKQTSWKQLHLLLCKLSNFHAFPQFFLVAGSLKNLFHCKLGAVGNKGKKMDHLHQFRYLSAKLKSPSVVRYDRNINLSKVYIFLAIMIPMISFASHSQCPNHLSCGLGDQQNYWNLHKIYGNNSKPYLVFMHCIHERIWSVSILDWSCILKVTMISYQKYSNNNCDNKQPCVMLRRFQITRGWHYLQFFSDTRSIISAKLIHGCKVNVMAF